MYESGGFTSTRHIIARTVDFAGDISWRRHLARIAYVFPLASAGNRTRKIVATGRAAAAQYGGHWHCIRTNTSFWAPPRFSLNHVMLRGATHLDGRLVWIVRGHYRTHSALERSRFTVLVYITRATSLLQRVVEVGRIQRGNIVARVKGVVRYAFWGEHVRVVVPRMCRP